MKTIIWDFDGVIIFSEEIRVRGFEILFQSFPSSAVARLLQFHADNGGLSRYVKIRYFYEEILQQSTSDVQVQNLADEFSKIMRKELLNPMLLNPQWLSFMSDFGGKINHHIASGSDGKELNFLCSELGISHYFKSINGSPTPKTKLVESILKSNCYLSSESCLIGDAINDWEAARQNSIRFFGYRNKVLKDRGTYLDSLTELMAYL